MVEGKYKERDIIHHEMMTEALPMPPCLLKVIEVRPGGYIVDQLDRPGHKFVVERYLDLICATTGWLERNGKPWKQFVCPKCGSPLTLEECGTYSGRRLLEADGTIVEDSYFEYGSDPTQFFIRCRSCEYEDRNIIVESDTVQRRETKHEYGRRRTDARTEP